MQLGKLGVWSSVDHLGASDCAAFAKSVEDWGYDALWIPEAVSRNAFVSSGWLLANTKRLVVATGIANIYARDAQASFAAQSGLNELSGGRFLMGLGVSHAPLVEEMRGHSYGRPVASMRAYLEAMSKALYLAPPPPERPLTVIAALGPKMLELSGTHADGAHTYNVTPEHTADARRILGSGKLLCVEQKVVLESDPARAREKGRATLKIYLGLRNYQENWRRQGLTENDWAGDGSDRLIDAMVAWGDEAAIRERLQQHWDAGADHVCVQALTEIMGPSDESLLALLAPSR